MKYWTLLSILLLAFSLIDYQNCFLKYKSVFICHCPYSFTISESQCIQSSDPTIFSEDFRSKTHLPKFGNQNLYQHLNSSIPSNPLDYSIPIPTVDRGLYFMKNSKLVSDPELILAPEFNLALFLKVYESGLVVKFGHKKNLLSIEITDNKIVLRLASHIGVKDFIYEIFHEGTKIWSFVEVKMILDEDFSVLEILGQRFLIEDSVLGVEDEGC